VERHVVPETRQATMNDQSYITYNYDLDLDLGLLSDNISDYNFCHILFIPYEAHGPAARAAAIIWATAQQRLGSNIFLPCAHSIFLPQRSLVAILSPFSNLFIVMQLRYVML